MPAVELMAPNGELWTWDEQSADSVRGGAFRHIDDTDLVLTGPRAEGWMSIAQAFAGPPGDGRRPGQFTGQD